MYIIKFFPNASLSTCMNRKKKLKIIMNATMNTNFIELLFSKLQSTLANGLKSLTSFIGFVLVFSFCDCFVCSILYIYSIYSNNNVYSIYIIIIVIDFPLLFFYRDIPDIMLLNCLLHCFPHIPIVLYGRLHTTQIIDYHNHHISNSD